mmetsp:Transcript_73293/g.195466  ORF Transcript_73293/g.195466 Transcript_73293/m.195466 type:complete len:167 (-) Transcript_73293:127-627(-)
MGNTACCGEEQIPVNVVACPMNQEVDDTGNAVSPTVRQPEALTHQQPSAKTIDHYSDQTPMEWTVTIVRTDPSEKLRLKWACRAGVFRVIEALADGPVAAWNRQNPRLAINPGDSILSVNNETDFEKIKEAMGSAPIVKLHVRGHQHMDQDQFGAPTVLPIPKRAA